MNLKKGRSSLLIGFLSISSTLMIAFFLGIERSPSIIWIVTMECIATILGTLTLIFGNIFQKSSMTVLLCFYVLVSFVISFAFILFKEWPIQSLNISQIIIHALMLIIASLVMTNNKKNIGIY